MTPHQTRDGVRPTALGSWPSSIRGRNGVIQPVRGAPAAYGRRRAIILILGERRWRASKIAGKTTIPAIVKRVSEQQAAEMTVVENLQRQDLHCLEQAQAFAILSRQFQLTQEEIGQTGGRVAGDGFELHAVLKLPPEVQASLQRDELTYSHARLLLSLIDDSQIPKVARVAVKENCRWALERW